MDDNHNNREDLVGRKGGDNRGQSVEGVIIDDDGQEATRLSFSTSSQLPPLPPHTPSSSPSTTTNNRHDPPRAPPFQPRSSSYTSCVPTDGGVFCIRTRSAPSPVIDDDGVDRYSGSGGGTTNRGPVIEMMATRMSSSTSSPHHHPPLADHGSSGIKARVDMAVESLLDSLLSQGGRRQRRRQVKQLERASRMEEQARKMQKKKGWSWIRSCANAYFSSYGESSHINM